jgi:hypothetical protein
VSTAHNDLVNHEFNQGIFSFHVKAGMCEQARCAQPFPTAEELGVHPFQPSLRSQKPQQCLLVFGAAFNHTSHFSDLWIESGPEQLWMDGIYVRSVSEEGYRAVERQVVAFREFLMTNVTLQGHKAESPAAKPYTAALSLYKRSYIEGEPHDTFMQFRVLLLCLLCLMGRMLHVWPPDCVCCAPHCAPKAVYRIVK